MANEHLPIPSYDAALLIRTDFTNDAAWHAVCRAVASAEDQVEMSEQVDGQWVEEYHPLKADIAFVSDPAFDNAPVDRVVAAMRASNKTYYVYLADSYALADPERSVLCVDFSQDPVATVRVVPAQMPILDANLSIANMFVEEFADAADPDGVFRGFSEP